MVRPVLHSGLRLGVVVLATALVAGCGGAKHPRREPVTVDRYLAVGDSYTSGPQIPPVADQGCLRSSRNYPSLVAKALHVASFADHSCAGAQPVHLAQPQRTATGSNPAQLEGLDFETDLVTMGIGMNAFGFANQLMFSCLRKGGAEPSTCPSYLALPDSWVSGEVDRVAQMLKLSLQVVQQKAPSARVVVVGYPRLAPDSGTCAALAMPAKAQQRLREALELADTRFATVARDQGAEYVDMYDASKGHDACSDDPWVNGAHPAKDQGAALHPRPAYFTEVAKRVVAAVRAGKAGD